MTDLMQKTKKKLILVLHEVVFLNPRGAGTQPDLNLKRVLYRDKPSIKMTIL